MSSWPNYLAPVVFSVLIAVCAMMPDSAAQWLIYDRAAIAAGELWRLVSAYWVHSNLAHALLNCAMLWLLWGFFSYQSAYLCSASFVLLSVLISLGLFFFVPQLEYYVGLSSVLHGWLVFSAILYWRRAPYVHGAMLTLIALKVLREQSPSYNDAAMRALIDWPVAEESHLLGLVAGVLLLLFAKAVLSSRKRVEIDVS